MKIKSIVYSKGRAKAVLVNNGKFRITVESPKIADKEEAIKLLRAKIKEP